MLVWRAFRNKYYEGWNLSSVRLGSVESTFIGTSASRRLGKESYNAVGAEGLAAGVVI